MSDLTNALLVHDLLTPTLLVNLNQTKINADRIGEKVLGQGVAIRPHVKTHKSTEIASFQAKSDGNPITVSTIAELIHFKKAGFANQLYAVPICVEKVNHIYNQIGIEGILYVTDSFKVVQELSDWAIKTNVVIDLLIKIDSGAGRAGLQPVSEDVKELAMLISELDGVCFKGLMTHAGQSYHVSNHAGKKEVAEKEVSSIVQTANCLEEIGIPVEIRSIGSTPTVVQDVDLSGITEVRAGNYIWFDLFQFNRGNCSLDEIGITVLSTIIGIYPERETILIDAGALAMSKDPGFWQDGKTRFGLVKSHPELEFTSLSQEHGILKASKEMCSKFTVGDKIEVYPNHSCLTAACFEYYDVIEQGKRTSRIKPAKFWV